MTYIAYCFAEGDIEFGETIPEGGLPIISGEEHRVNEVIYENCQYGNFSGIQKPMIKAVNDAKDDGYKAIDELIKFTDLLKEKYKDDPDLLI